MTDDLYKRAGVEDLSEFYRTKFVSDEVLDARYFRALDRFDVRFARTMWVYDNVRAGSSVLDLGCGAGMLALLKRKGVTLAGVDLSHEGALASRRNGYDFTCSAELTRLPFADDSFDYAVSLDVLGHVDFVEKDAVLSEVRRVLRPGGVTLHGIECTDRLARGSYEEMTEEELRRFVAVDGHVGLEEEHEHAERFRRFFAHVAWEPRYALCLSSEEFIKQRDEYGLPFEPDFVEYLRGLSHSERRAFDMAMGYVFGKVSDLGLRLPRSGLYVFLKASDAPLGPFYNEHRDRSALFNGVGPEEAGETPALEATRSFCLDRAADFDDGWYEPNVIPPVARWMKRRARARFRAPHLRALRLDLTTHMPGLGPEDASRATRPLRLELLLNGRSLSSLSLYRYGWLSLLTEVPEELSRARDFELELRADRTWRPRPDDPENRDDRELSIAVCNIEAFV
ncbi:MAG TPA: methyltransferase domain-containing protein [Pyrinomonadaceae bacterium]|jgi:SAM-dependent methyltransferase|nr:methyltransferase domain-containing protein [Pyrinomonadaceae bacterium]